MQIIEARNLIVGYSERRISENLSLVLRAGQFTCLLGPNGAGKTTLMRTLAGMLPPLHGTVLIQGDSVNQLSPQDLALRLAVVLTERTQLGYMTGYELVALGRHPYTGWRGVLADRDRAVIAWALAVTGSEAIAAQPMDQLSDGQRQKLLIARALAQEPAALLLDEPTAFLDLPRRVDMMQLLRELAHQAGKAVLLSTHDLDLALRTADELWLMAADGRLHTGTPEDLILNGAFETVFQSEGVTFDASTGAFRMRSATQQAVGVAGEGLRWQWTCRALERAGYRVEAGARPAILVDATRWTLMDTDTQFDSIGALLEALQANR